MKVKLNYNKISLQNINIKNKIYAEKSSIKNSLITNFRMNFCLFSKRLTLYNTEFTGFYLQNVTADIDIHAVKITDGCLYKCTLRFIPNMDKKSSITNISNILFAESTIKKGILFNTIFKGCSFSDITFEDNYFYNTTFLNCTFSGCSITKSINSTNKPVFINCNFNPTFGTGYFLEQFSFETKKNIINNNNLSFFGCIGLANNVTEENSNTKIKKQIETKAGCLFSSPGFA